ncbi:unnamed protein product [Paramecium primaurelia]|uniref:Uncharacterized protein n=2 Tax=Paramecium TaxID=5884 RepID=A0A8S1YDG7_9CILI|nr:unnamed protein product [Paramecium primaurelia]CAD8210857.1 unnamed protein product [Paramecium pentaurelia]
MEQQHKVITEPGETNTSSQQFFSTNTLFLNNVGLSTNISSSTLRHTAPQISFPKANRFHTQSQFQLPTKLELPSQLGKRYTQQGFGNKKVFQYEWQKVNAKEFPSPDRYRVRQDPGIDQLKRSFGLSWEAYSKTYLPYNKHQAPEVAKFLPGPGEYNVRQDLGQHRYQFQLKGKGKMFNDQRENGVPGPETYQPQISLTVPNRFSKISQGIGVKKNPFQSMSFTPGPGRYEQNSAFDKVSKKREFITKPGEKRPFI